MTKWIAAALFGLGVLAGGEAEAQMFFKHRGRVVGSGYSSPAATVSGSSYAPGGVATGVAASRETTPYPYYSYYAAYPNAARGYVGYTSSNDFPFYGQAYGHPYDRWTWPYLAGPNASGLARYYDPPVK